jgi:hypothetical protein
VRTRRGTITGLRRSERPAPVIIDPPARRHEERRTRLATQEQSGSGHRAGAGTRASIHEAISAAFRQSAGSRNWHRRCSLGSHVLAENGPRRRRQGHRHLVTPLAHDPTKPEVRGHIPYVQRRHLTATKRGSRAPGDCTVLQQHLVRLPRARAALRLAE